MVTGAKFLAIIRNYKPSEKKMATESELSLLAALATKVNRVAASLGDRDPDSFGGTPSAEPVQDCPGPYLPAGQSSVPGQGRLYGDWRGKGFISVPQQKRFYAICRQRGMDEPAIIAWLSGNGLASIADIQQSQYDQLTAAVK